jgi:protein SCO1/2
MSSGRTARYFWSLYIVLLVVIIVYLLLSSSAFALEDMSQARHDAHHHHEQHSSSAKDGRYRRSAARYAVPDVRVVSEDGRISALRSVLEGDGPVFLNFIFTTCTAICPVLTATFAQVQERLGPEREQVRMISLSIDPEQDTPEQLLAYGRKYGAGPQWRFFTGALADMLLVEKSFGVYRGNKMNHEPVTFVRSGPGDQWLRIDGFASADDLVREYRRLRLP